MEQEQLPQKKLLSKKSIIILVIVLVVVGLFTIFAYSQKANPSNKSNNIVMQWNTIKNGYSVQIPTYWQTVALEPTRAVFEPSVKISSIDMISIFILSDINGKGKKFTTQKEFDYWYSMKGNVPGSVQKTKSTIIDGHKAVILFDTHAGPNKWISITWMRLNNRNYYIDAKGDGQYSKIDEAIIQYVDSHFMF